MTVEPLGRHTHDLQGFGAVVLLDADLRMVRASSSCAAVLGSPAAALIGEPLTVLLSEADVDSLRAALAESLAAVGWRRIYLNGTGEQMKLHAFDAGEGLLGLDILPLPSEPPGTDAQAVERVAGWTQRLIACQTMPELLEVVAQLTRERTHYDGAWVTRLEPDGDAVILASAQDGTSRVLGQRLPRRDLPPDQPVVGGRYVPFFVADLQAEATGLVPDDPGVDLQGSALLRPFSEYLAQLATIGVRAQASIPIVVDGRLWGRVSAAHSGPSRLTAATQAELALIGAAAGTRLVELIELDAAHERVQLSRSSGRVVRSLAATTDLVAGLTRDGDALRAMCDADAAIVSAGGQVVCIGAPLGETAVAQLLEAAGRAVDEAPAAIASTTSLRDAADPDVAAGFLAVRLAGDARDLVVWTRGERRRQVTWLTQTPDAGTLPGPLGEGVTARTEVQRGHCDPWTDTQVSQPEELREAISEALVARYAQMQLLTDELRRSNEEYDAFAHAAAHDLKAPLRAMRLATEFLFEDTRARLSEAEREEFEKVLRLGGRMNELLDDLLAYARVGREEWDPEEVALPAAVGQVVELLGVRAAQATIDTAQATITADPAALRQLLLNLVGNAVKYSSGPATVGVGLTTLGAAATLAPVPRSLASAPADTPVLTVTDDGIGIDPVHHDKIFGLFRQVDPRAEGSGAGLALCRLICRRHGGDLWLRSALGEGTTFYVVPGQPGDASTT